MKKVLVLGSGGFIGASLVNHLHKNGYEVTAFDKRPIPGLLEKLHVRWFSGDFLTSGDIEQLIEKNEFDIIYHLVATKLPASSNLDPVGDCLENVVSSLRLLEAIRKKNNMPRFVFISSGGTVYGASKHFEPIQEYEATDPICAYGISKLVIEKYLYMYHAAWDLDYIVLRLSNPYGEYQVLNSNQGIINVAISNALSGQPLEIWGDGEITRDFIYIEDVLKAMVNAGTLPVSSRVVNIGSGKATTINEVLTVVMRSLPVKLDIVYKPARNVDVKYNVLNIGLASEVLSWRPEVTLELGIKKIVDFYLRYFKDIRQND